MEAFYWVLPSLLAGRPGPQVAPWDLKELWAAGFRTVVSLVPVESEPIRAAGFRHLLVPLNGGLAFLPPMRQRLAQQMEPVIDFVAGEIAAGRPTLVHCRQGNDRTGAVLAGYLIRYQGLNPEEAIRRLREANPRALRSLGFKQLVKRLADFPHGNR
ncbi:MAG: dual specificity protein phosphatase family protein [Anaerolineae bacterium]|nr:dual specificity protein phosphatase family protein [Anaerolineae bacterium]MDW8067297.1 dual specificity protein phosphatase family protein [Anaerolineae bacterium]